MRAVSALVALLLLAVAVTRAANTVITFRFQDILKHTPNFLSAPAVEKLSATLVPLAGCAATSPVPAGSAFLQLDRTTGQLRWSVAWTGLPSPVLALRLLGSPLTDGVTLDLGAVSGLVSPSEGAVNGISAVLSSELLAGFVRVELHTLRCTLSGQVLPITSPPNAPPVPPTTSTASTTATATTATSTTRPVTTGALPTTTPAAATTTAAGATTTVTTTAAGATTTVTTTAAGATTTAATTTATGATTTAATTTAAGATTTAATTTASTTAAGATTTATGATTTTVTTTTAPTVSSTTTTRAATVTSTTTTAAAPTVTSTTTSAAAPTTAATTSTTVASATTTTTTSAATTTATLPQGLCLKVCLPTPLAQLPNAAGLGMRTVELLAPDNAATWANTTVNAGIGTLVPLTTPIACATAGLQICRVYVDFPASNFQLLGATLLGINNGTNACALSTNDPQGFFFANGDNTNVGPQGGLYVNNTRRSWNLGVRDAGDLLCSTYATVGEAPEVPPAYCVASPVANFWNTDGTLVADSTWFCAASATRTQLANALQPPNGPGNSMLIAQFTVRRGYSVRGTMMVQARNFPNPAGLLTATLAFQCFCP